jgi:hypothetical protein
MNSRISHRRIKFLIAIVLLPLLFVISAIESHGQEMIFQEPCDTTIEWLFGGHGLIYYWKQPPNHEFLNMQFEMPPDHGGRLEYLQAGLYESGSSGTPDPSFYVWLSDGVFPLDDNPPFQAIAEFHLDYGEIQWYPYPTTVQAYPLGIIFDPGEIFHVGVSHSLQPGDTLAYLSDDGSLGTERSSGWNGTVWEDYWPFEIAIHAAICPFPRIPCGDCNGDASIDLGDVVYLLSHLFKGGSPPDPLCLGDVNCDGVVDVGDVIRMLNYLFGWLQPICPACCAVSSGMDEAANQMPESLSTEKKPAARKLPHGIVD